MSFLESGVRGGGGGERERERRGVPNHQDIQVGVKHQQLTHLFTSSRPQKHAAPGTFINTADFQSPQALAEHLLHLNSNPEEYVKVLQAKDQYQSLYEDWPLRNDRGHIRYMTYHYGAVAFCQMCQRLWDLPRYRHTVPDIGTWVDKHNCYPPKDLH